MRVVLQTWHLCHRAEQNVAGWWRLSVMSTRCVPCARWPAQGLRACSQQGAALRERPGRAGLPHQPPAHGVPCWPHLTSRPGMDPHLELPPGSRPRSTWDPGTAQAEPQRKKRSAPQTEDDVLTSSVPAPTGHGQNGVLTYKGLETQQLCNLVPVADARGGAGCSQRGASVSG